MYKALKSLVKKVVPKTLLVKNEQLIRQLTYLFYRGDRFECNICQAKLSTFIHLESDDLLCPKCGSLPRTRRLWTLLSPLIPSNPKILHFSPSRTLFRKLKAIKKLDYLSTDFEDEFLADQKLDIRDTGLDGAQFDVIICFHVLEHIDEDTKAMNELFRLLKSGGRCFIQTPFKKGEIYENSAISTPEERIEHFGQWDHVRVYSPEGLKTRLEAAHFKVDIMNYKNEPDNRLGFKEPEIVLIASKA